MTKEQIRTVVLKHLMDSVESLRGKEVDTSRSMKDLGANSLDIVEVVSSAMRELKIKIPRSELSKLTNVDDLVTMLHDVKTAKKAS